MRKIPDDNLSYPVLIERGGKGGGGSGFFVNSGKSFFLVTAAHVLFDKQYRLKETDASVLCYASDLVTPVRIELSLQKLKSARQIKTHPVYDVAVIKVGYGS